MKVSKLSGQPKDFHIVAGIERLVKLEKEPILKEVSAKIVANATNFLSAILWGMKYERGITCPVLYCSSIL